MSGIVEAVRGIESADVRVVARLGAVDFSIEYIREDVAPRYSVDDLDDAYQLIMANQVTGDDFKQLIGESTYQAQTLFFEDIVVCLFPSDRYEAVFASFDRTDELPVAELVERVTAAQA